MTMTEVHSTAIVGDDVELGSEVSIGPYTVIEGNVRIGSDTSIGPHCQIKGPVTMGSDNRLQVGCVVGTEPQDWSYEAGSQTGVEIGSGNILREYVTINRATKDGGMTRVGDENMIMSYSHVAHDCELGDDIDMANGVSLAGHVTIGDHAIISGHTGFHQFVRIGEYAMVGGLSRIVKDVLPYLRVSGNPLEVYGLNSIGLKRNDFSSETRNLLKRVFKVLFRDGNNTSQALEILREEYTGESIVQELIDFIENSERGIHK
jgi:UDP-N-acetylglucosamine acyltransferase